MFDAGAIEARLTVNTAQFDRDMDKAEARVKSFTDSTHKVKISAVFDNASLSKATKAFTDLDNQISRQAMSRLRSSPQGSVLGALTALFSPHPVTGAPSPSQAASQGLLGKIVTAPGGGGAAAATGTSSTRSQAVNQVLGGTTTSNTVKTTDRVSVLGMPTSGGTVTTKVKEDLDAASAAATEAKAKESGGRAGKGWISSFLSSVNAMLPSLSASIDKSSGGGGKNGSDAGVLDKGLIGGIGPGILGTSFKTAGISGLLGAGLGAIPALGAVGAGAAAIGGGAALLISQNAQVKKSATDLVATLKSTFLAAAAPMIAPLQQALGSLSTTFKQLEPLFKQVFAGAAPLIKPLTDGLEGLVKGLLPGLVAILKAAGPAFAVFSSFLAGIGSGLGAMFKSFSTVIGPSSVLLKALLDVVLSLFPTLASLGTTMASTLGPAFKAFAGAVQALLPFITTVAKIFSQFAGAVLTDLSGGLQLVASILKAVAPAFNTLATAIGQVFNTLESKGGFAQIGDILEALATPIGNLVKTLIDGLAPAIPPLLTLFSALVNILSTVGVQVLTALIPPLTKFATEALGAIVKILPAVVPLITKFLGVFTEDAAKIILAIAVPLANLANVVLTKLLVAAAPLVPIFIALLEALTPITNVLTVVFVRIITDLATALTAIITAIPPSVLQGIAVAFIAIATAAKLWAIAQGILDIALDANPIGLILIAVAALAVGIVELVQHWNTVWGAIKAVAEDAWNFLWNGWGKYLLALFGVSGLLVLALIETYQHWNTIWGAIKTAAMDVANFFTTVFGTDLAGFFTKTIPGWWDELIGFFSSHLVTPLETGFKNVVSFLVNDIGTPIETFFTKTIPGWWDMAITFLGTHFITPIENGFKAVWAWIQANFGLPINTFFTKTLPGYWDNAITFLGSHFVTPFQNSLKGAYDWVVKNVATPIQTLFTKTMPGWFGTAVSAISGLWTKVENAVLTPVKFVVNNVLDKLIGLFDDVTNAVGLGKPIPTVTLARGGKLPGFGGGDTVPALLEPGEAVIDKDKTAKYGWLFKMMGVPGFAAGGVAGNPITSILHVAGDIGKDILGGTVDMAKAVAAIATGNSTALANAVTSMFGGGSAGGMGGVMGQAMLGMPATLVKDFAKWIVGTKNTAQSQEASAAGGSATLKPSGSGATIQALMQSMAASVGWTGAEWTALDEVENREAGFNLTAQNPSSGAYGLAQFINGASEYASYGGNSTTAAGQITGMLNYIKQRYGDPEAAWAHELAYGWYDNGGALRPGYTLAYNGTGKTEHVSTARQMGDSADALAAIADRLDTLIDVTGAVPAGVGRHVGGALGGAAQDASFRSRYPHGGS